MRFHCCCCSILTDGAFGVSSFVSPLSVNWPVITVSRDRYSHKEKGLVSKREKGDFQTTYHADKHQLIYRGSNLRSVCKCRIDTVITKHIPKIQIYIYTHTSSRHFLKIWRGEKKCGAGQLKLLPRPAKHKFWLSVLWCHIFVHVPLVTV